MMRSLLPCLGAAALVLAACGEDPRVTQQTKARREVEAVQEQVRATPHVQSTGRWDEAQLTQRLVSAGLAPHPDDSVPAHPKFSVKAIGYRVGKAHLLAWIFADSAARRATSAGVDTLTAIPQGQSNPWAEPPMFVVQNNLMAVVVGGSDRQRERVRLAIEAGLSAPAP